LALALLSALALAGAARAACDRNLVAEIPVTMKGARGLRPMVAATLNGVDAHMLFDTGAAESVLFTETQTRLGVSEDPNTPAAYGRSLGRLHKVTFALAKSFVFAGRAHSDVRFGISETGFGQGIDGLVGQDFMGDGDLEIDLAHGAIRLFAPRGCEAADLAYWRGQQAASVIELETDSAGQPRMFGMARVNGVPLRVMFDTGTADTHMTYEASLRAGVDPAAPGPTATPGPGMVGLGGGAPLASWRVRFDRFQIGAERMVGPTLIVVEKPNATADMLIGADFFVSHRVFISRSQHKVYFTANPGVAFPRQEP
jgi:predicted aspartyl protease